MAKPRPPRPHRQERERNRELRQRAEAAQGARPGAGPGAGGDEPIRLFGVHAVEAALRNPARRVLRLVATENGEARLFDAPGKSLDAPLDSATRSRPPGEKDDAPGEGAAPGHVPRRPPGGVERASPRDLDRILGADTVHQGMMLEVEPLDEPSLDDLAEAAAVGAPLLALDQVTDPHNVGAVLRSAAVFGAGGLIMTRRHSPPLNGTLAKSASGALELVPVHLAQNLARTLADLKARGLTLLGLDGTADTAIEDHALASPLVLVLGAEGKGLRQSTRELCDQLVRITAAGTLASLNVSNAAAVALHLAAMRRRETQKR